MEIKQKVSFRCFSSIYILTYFIDMREKNSETLNRWSFGSPKLSARIEEETMVETNNDVVKDNNFGVKSIKSQEPARKEEKESMLSKLKKIRKCT